MGVDDFIAVGELIHCSRANKVGGRHVREQANGSYAIEFRTSGRIRLLPVPRRFIDSADWQAGQLHPCRVALWQGLRGREHERSSAAAYLAELAQRQARAGARWLDINVDDYGADVDERIRAMTWIAEVVQPTVPLPLSIDSSQLDVLRAGLTACDPARGRPLLNSVSLDRMTGIDLATEFDAAVIASAAGATQLPTSAEERLHNLESLLPRLRDAGLDERRLCLDLLVFPISTDSSSGRAFLEAVRSARQAYGDGVPIVSGLSNVSFGMPKRRLINQVFARLAVDAGANGGIVDPLQVNARILDGLDRESEAFALARALLLGEDEFGMAFLAACRDGRL